MKKIISKVKKQINITETLYLNEFKDTLISRYSCWQKPEEMIDLLVGTEDEKGLSQSGYLDFAVRVMVLLANRHGVKSEHRLRFFEVLKNVHTDSKNYNTNISATKLLIWMVNDRPSKKFKKALLEHIFGDTGPLSEPHSRNASVAAMLEGGLVYVDADMNIQQMK